MVYHKLVIPHIYQSARHLDKFFASVRAIYARIRAEEDSYSQDRKEEGSPHWRHTVKCALFVNRLVFLLKGGPMKDRNYDMH
jgi:hypothetical protein